MFLQPLGSRVIVMRKLIGRRGRLFIPVGSQEMKFNIGDVVAIGPDVTDAVRVGDRVTFGRYAPVNIDKMEMETAGISPPPEDEEYLLMNEDDILCHIVKDEEDAELEEVGDAG
jgi:co-chaperonin GroES (HSP10)